MATVINAAFMKITVYSLLSPLTQQQGRQAMMARVMKTVLEFNLDWSKAETTSYKLDII